MDTKKKIIALSGSIREDSSTEKALKCLKYYFPKNIDFKIYNGIQKLPYFNPELDHEQALQLNLSMLNANVFEGGALLISGANRKLNDNGEFVNEEVVSSLKSLISNMMEEINSKTS